MTVLSYPHWQIAHSSLSKLNLLLWNPYQNLGEPFLADPQTMIFYPLLWLFSPINTYLNFLRNWVVLHTLLAAIFMGLLAFKLFKDEASAVCAAILAGFNGFFMARVTFTNHFAAAAWLPAALYFQSRLSPFGLGTVLALQWFAGFPPFSLLTILAVLGTSLLQGKRGLLCFLKGGFVAAGLSAVQLIPFLELMFQSVRQLFLDSAFAGEYSLPVNQLIKEVFLPQWYGINPVMKGDPQIVCFYTGIIAVGLAIFAVWKGERREKCLALAVLAAMLMSLGGSLPFYARLSFLHIFRFPANWLLLVAAGIALLCASGISYLKDIRGKWFVVFFVVFDLVWFAQYVKMAWVKPSFLTDRPPLLEQVTKNDKFSRLYHTEVLMRLYEKTWLREEKNYLALRNSLAPSYGTAFGLYEVNSYQVLRTKLSDRYQQRLHRQGKNSPLLDWAGVSAVVTTDKPKAESFDPKDLLVVLRNTAKP